MQNMIFSVWILSKENQDYSNLATDSKTYSCSCLFQCNGISPFLEVKLLFNYLTARIVRLKIKRFSCVLTKKERFCMSALCMHEYRYLYNDICNFMSIKKYLCTSISRIIQLFRIYSFHMCIISKAKSNLEKSGNKFILSGKFLIPAS